MPTASQSLSSAGEHIALFYDKKFELVWRESGKVSGRPLQVALFKKKGLHFVVVNVHNNHGALRTVEIMQNALKDVRAIDTQLRCVLRDAVIICLGDRNNPSESFLEAV